jgi:hypothetical protein
MKTDIFLNRNAVNRRPNEIAADSPVRACELAQDNSKPIVVINHNGSRWAGEEPADLAELLDLLATTPLRPDFEQYGNFITEQAISCTDDKPLFAPGFVKFWGNFFQLSHGFDIITNDPAAIAELTEAIRANQQTQAYKDAKRQEAIWSKEWAKPGIRSRRGHVFA